MNAFNRIVVVLLLVLMVIAVILVVAAPQQSFDVAAGSFDWLSATVKSYQEQSWPLWTIGRVVAGAVIGLLLLIVLWLEFRRKRVRIIRAQKLEGATPSLPLTRFHSDWPIPSTSSQMWFVLCPGHPVWAKQLGSRHRAGNGARD